MLLYYINVDDWDGLDAQQAAELAHRAGPAYRARAAAMKQKTSARTVLASALLLRCILGARADEIRPDPLGKPFVPGGPEFNVSHGGSLAVLAVADVPCGVDCEPLSRKILHPERLFPPDELALAISPVILWTRRESIYKADGRGIRLLHEPLDLSQPALQCRGNTYALKTHIIDSHAVSCAALCPPSALDQAVPVRIRAVELLR